MKQCPICQSISPLRTPQSVSDYICPACGANSRQRIARTVQATLGVLLDFGHVDALIIDPNHVIDIQIIKKVWRACCWDTDNKRELFVHMSQWQRFMDGQRVGRVRYDPDNSPPQKLVCVYKMLSRLRDDRYALKQVKGVMTGDSIVLINELDDPKLAHTIDLDPDDEKSFGRFRRYGRDLPARIAEALDVRFVARIEGRDEGFTFVQENYYVAGNDHQLLGLPLLYPHSLCELYDFSLPDRDESGLPEPITREKRLVFFPDYSAANPYQTLLYGNILLAGPGDIDKALQLQQRENSDIATIFHLHWTAPIFEHAGNDSQMVRRLMNEFIEKVEAFIQAGGDLVWTIHNVITHESLHRELEEQFSARLAELATRVILHTTDSQEILARYFQLPAQKVTIAPHGNYIHSYPVDCSPLEARKSLQIPEDATVFLFFGQVRRYKGVRHLIRAFKTISQSNPNIWLIIVGRVLPDDFRREITALCTEAPRIITELEFIHDQDVQRYFLASDFAVLPFRQILNSGSALLSLSFARPVIAPRLGVLRSLLQGMEELTYDPEDREEALVKRMLAAAAFDKKQVRTFMEKAYELVLDMPWSASTQIINGLIKELFFKGDERVAPSGRPTYQSPAPSCRPPARVAIVVCHYGNLEDTMSCLRSLDADKSEPFHGYLVSNDDDLTAYQYVRRVAPHWTCIQSPGNIGFAAGCNLALRDIKDAGYDYIWLVNPDTIAPSNHLTRLVQNADALPESDIFGTTIVMDDDPDFVWYGGACISFEHGLQAKHLHYGESPGALPEGPYSVDYVTGASLFFRSHLLDDIGLLPERYFLYFEETDWCMQARAHGKNLVMLPELILRHKRRSVQKGVPTFHYLYYYTRNLLLMCRTWNPNKLDRCVQHHRKTLAASWLKKYEQLGPQDIERAKDFIELGFRDGLAGVQGYCDLNRFLDQMRLKRLLPDAS
ncbi:hypothetical protein DQK91_05360 [Oceanidesulfovibrio marinus]|uniref:Glycosyltransferase, GT2 family n=2 Tax=Oceanidesulfovibrio marinus TaxID=370038 RepID=A0A6P1ZKH0_9BACT|nr:hypothetical protein DQK91_05360 [Oceanidesulfovibrio marinus]